MAFLTTQLRPTQKSWKCVNGDVKAPGKRRRSHLIPNAALIPQAWELVLGITGTFSTPTKNKNAGNTWAKPVCQSH